MKTYFKTPELNELFDEYLKMRKKIRKPATKHAEKLAVEKIIKFSNGSLEMAKMIINKAILNSNQGIWPISEYERKLYDK